MIIEIATTDLETTRSAVEGGADRIELCAALSDGGTTPSLGTIRRCRELFTVQLYPIIRPRAGDFLYTVDEFATMCMDVKACKELGCDGVVIGILTSQGEIDKARTAHLIELAYPMGVTFHRAFDRCADPFKALEELIEIGCERILTSGQRSTAPEGGALIASLQQKADGQIIIMPGSGVRVDNIRQLADQTGCQEFHSSLRSKKDSAMEFIHPAFANSLESYANPAINAADVKALRAALVN